MPNILSMLFGSIVVFILGGLWYGPLFSRPWMTGMGWDVSNKLQMDAMKKAAGPAYAQQFMGTLLMATALSTVIWSFSIAAPFLQDWQRALLTGTTLWCGVILPVKYGEHLWGKRPLSVFCIDAGYYFLAVNILSFILTLWK